MLEYSRQLNEWPLHTNINTDTDATKIFYGYYSTIAIVDPVSCSYDTLGKNKKTNKVRW